jgi:uncharacterized DUF497 family protein
VIFNDLFTWDEDKNKSNAIKHGVTFQEASTVFKDNDAIVLDDYLHSADEERFIIIGKSERQRILMVCHCFRENNELIRIITARKAVKAERKLYGGN